MYKLFSIFSISSLLQGHAINRSILAFMSEIPRTFKVVNRRALSTIGTTLILSALLSACGGGGGGGSDAPAPTSTAPIFSVLSSNFSVDEDFATPQIVALVANATAITVSQSNTGVVTVTTSNSRFIVSSIANANGRTILTIRATNGAFSATTQVTVTVNAVNDPPTLAVSSSNISTVGGFSPIAINTTASDIEDGALAFTVSESTTGVVRVTTSANAITLNALSNASGQTTLTITAVDSSGSTVTQTIAVDVTITTSTSIPALSVSSNIINVQEDFTTSVVIRTTATDADGDAITLSVSTSSRLVDVAISTPNNSTNTITNSITLSAVANANGTATLTVRATDAGGQSTEVNIVVVVAAVNDAPTLIIPTLDLVLAEDFVGTRTFISAVDLDSNNILTITVVESTTGVVTVTTSDSSVQVASIADINGKTTLSITISDGILSSTAQLVVTVTAVNDAPSLNISTTNVVVDEDFANAVAIATATDVENNTLTISVAESTTDVVTVTTSASSVSVSSILNANGQTTLTITVNDGTSDTTAQVVVIVTAVNDTPTLTIPNANLVLAEDFSGNSTIATAVDIDGDPLTFSVVESTTGVVTVSTSASGVSISNRPHANGVTTLTITVRDGSLSSTAQVVVIVTAANDTPTLTIPNASLVLAEDFSGNSTIATAVDINGDPLTFSVVESTTGVVTVSTSASGVSISNRPHANGVTTLIITVRDGSLSSTDQVVVDVTPVNDTPTLTVTSKSLSVYADPVVLTVSAFDVEDSTLSFSVSTGQGVVNTAITTNRLTITRLDLNLNAPQIMLILRTTDTANVSVSTVVTVALPPALLVTTSIKTLNFAWSAISTATHYQLQSNPDGHSGFTDLSTTDIVVSPNSTNIRQTTAQALVALHRHIPNVRNPQYSVGTCNTASSCGPSFRHNTVSLTNAQLNSMIGRLQASNAQIGDSFGSSLSLSGDGNTLAVGAANEDSSSTGVNGAQNNNSTDTGAVYVFRRIGGAWSQQAYIKASNTGVLDYFGFSVSLSTDGNTLAVGAWDEDGSSTGVNGAQDDSTVFGSGAVYVFRRIGGAWSQQAYIKASNTGRFDAFGWSVSLSADGNTLAVGAYWEGSSSTGVNGAQNDNNAFNAGAVYVFRFSTGSSTWSQQAYIKASNTGSFDRFGLSVSLSADGNTLAVGAFWEGSSSTGVNGAQDDNNAGESGAVYVFRFSTGSSIWSQQAYIKASNTGVSDFFGLPVSLSSDGNTLAVGATMEDGASTGVNGAQNNNSTNTGAVYLFRFSTGSNTWAQQAYIKASNTGRNDEFGEFVSLSADGNTLAVSALSEDGSATGVGGVDDNSTDDAGAVYVFEFSNGTWAQRAYIKSSNTQANDEFGTSLSLSNDGHVLAVGAQNGNGSRGAVYLY